eukprot:Pgem_evm1s11741
MDDENEVDFLLDSLRNLADNLCDPEHICILHLVNLDILISEIYNIDFNKKSVKAKKKLAFELLMTVVTLLGPIIKFVLFQFFNCLILIFDF